MRHETWAERCAFLKCQLSKSTCAHALVGYWMPTLLSRYLVTRALFAGLLLLQDMRTHAEYVSFQRRRGKASDEDRHNSGGVCSSSWTVSTHSVSDYSAEEYSVSHVTDVVDLRGE